MSRLCVCVMFSNTDGRLDLIAARTMFQLGTMVSTQTNIMGGVHRLAQADSLVFTFAQDKPTRVHMQVCMCVLVCVRGVGACVCVACVCVCLCVCMCMWR